MEGTAGIRILAVKIKIRSGFMKNFKGFSLAEMMIVLLIISITLAATAPMITRKITKSRTQDKDNNEQVFRPLKSDPKHAVEYIKGLNQRILMGPSKFGITSSEQLVPTDSTVIGATEFYYDDGKPFDGVNDSDFWQDGSIAIGKRGRVTRGSINIGQDSKVHAFESIAIGNRSETFSDAAIAIGVGSHVSSEKYNQSVEASGVAIGTGAGVERYGTALGNIANAGEFATALGYWAKASNFGTSIGYNAYAGENSIAIGNKVRAEHANTIYIGDSGHSVHIPGTLFANLNSPSDIRLKNLGNPYTDGLDALNKLKFYHYTFKKDKAQTPHVGVIAQELQKVFPNAVTKGSDGYLQIRLEDMFYAAINAIKELNTKVITLAENMVKLTEKTDKQQEELTAQAELINIQQQKIDELTARLEKLEKRKK